MRSAFIDIESKQTAWENANRRFARLDSKSRDAFEQDNHSTASQLDPRDPLTHGVPRFVAIFPKFELVDLQFRIAGNLRERAWDQNETCPCSTRSFQNSASAQFRLRICRAEVG